MLHRFSREELLIGAQGLEKLQRARVAVFGIGGVGGYVVEALARSGVGALDLFDGDRVSLTNINRQIIALQSTVGRLKTAVMAERISDINPAAAVVSHPVFYTAENAEDFPLEDYDFIVDAIDTVSSKLLLIEQARAAGAKVISCMGAGNKLHTEFEIADIEKTSVCPLARRMRTELKKRGIQGVLAVYSKEPPLRPQDGERAPASISYVPGAAGLTLAGAVIRDLLGR